MREERCDFDLVVDALWMGVGVLPDVPYVLIKEPSAEV